MHREMRNRRGEEEKGKETSSKESRGRVVYCGGPYTL